MCPWVLEHRGESAGEVARSTSTTPGAPIHSRRLFALAASGSPRRRPARQCAAEVSPLAQFAPFATAASAGRTDQRTAASPGSDSAGRYSATIAIRPSQQRAASGSSGAPGPPLSPRSRSPALRSWSSSIPSVSRTLPGAAPWPTKAAVLIDPTREVRPPVAELAPPKRGRPLSCPSSSSASQLVGRDPHAIAEVGLESVLEDRDIGPWFGCLPSGIDDRDEHPNRVSRYSFADSYAKAMLRSAGERRSSTGRVAASSEPGA